MLPVMRDADALVVISSYLRSEEAGMLRGLLESAGIVAVLRDEMVSAVNPFMQSAIGGVKLVVRAADAERAREIIRSAGVPPGLGPEEPVEIPEEEWSRAEPESSRAVYSLAPPMPAWKRRVLLALLVLLALMLGLG